MAFFVLLALLSTVNPLFGLDAEGLIAEFDTIESGRTIDAWTVVGPFDVSIQSNTTEGLPLSDASDCVSEGDLFALLESSAVASRQVSQADLSVPYLDFHDALGIERPKGKRGQLFLAACRLRVAERKEFILEVAKDDWAALYFDGEQLAVTKRWNAPLGGLYWVPVTLEPGEHFLLVQVYSKEQRAALKITVRAEDEYAWKAEFNEFGDVLERQIVRSGDAPRIGWRLGNRPLSFDVVVVDERTGVEVSAGSLAAGDEESLAEFGSLPDGVYSARFSWRERTWSEDFVLGDPRNVAAAARELAERWRIDDEATMNIDALLRRTEILLLDRHYDPRDLAWAQKFVFAQSELARICRRLEAGEEAFAGDPGLHLRGFRSAIDDSVQHYRLSIPEDYSPEKPLPLMIVPATTISARRPFLESAFVASHNDALHIAKLASEKGMAVLWPGYRNVPQGLPIELSHLDEVLEAVGRDYAIDHERVSLVGICSGGIFAGQAIARWPDRFNAVVFENAIFGREPWAGVMGLGLEWCEESGLVDSILANGAVSIFAINDDTRQFGHGEMALTKRFLVKARGFGREVASDLSQSFAVSSNWTRIFDFVANRPVRATVDAQMAGPFARYEGSIASVFDGPFILVEGTIGTEEETAAIRSASRSFQRRWGELFFGARCRAKRDVELTERDVEIYSLVLLGDERSNMVWRESRETLPPGIDGSGVRYGDREWKGGGDFVSFACVESPYGTGRKALLATASDAEALLTSFAPESLLSSPRAFELWRIDSDGFVELVMGLPSESLGDGLAPGDLRDEEGDVL